MAGNGLTKISPSLNFGKILFDNIVDLEIEIEISKPIKRDIIEINLVKKKNKTKELF